MTKTQRIVKKLAIIFAIVLIVAIFSSVAKICSLVLLIVSPDEEGGGNLPTENTVTETNKNAKEYDISKISNIELKLGATSLEIKKGNNFKIYSNNDDVKISNDKNNTLKIKEKDNFGFVSVNKTDKVVIIWIPEDTEFNNFELESGAGIVEIEGLTSKNADLELGAGEVNITELNITEKAEINGGAGKLSIEGTINELAMELGLGELNLTAKLASKSSIEFGIGNANITLLGAEKNYALDISKGIGTVKVGGKHLSEYKTSADTNAVKVDLECGVGNIDIDFK